MLMKQMSAVAALAALLTVTSGCADSGPSLPGLGDSQAQSETIADSVVNDVTYAENVHTAYGRALVLSWTASGRDSDFDLQVCSGNRNCRDALRFHCMGRSQCMAVDPQGIPADGYRLQQSGGLNNDGYSPYGGYPAGYPIYPGVTSSRTFRFEDFIVTSLRPGDSIRIRARAGGQTGRWVTARRR